MSEREGAPDGMQSLVKMQQKGDNHPSKLSMNYIDQILFEAGIFGLHVRDEPRVPGDRPPAALAPEGGAAGLSRPVRVADGPQRGEEGGQGVLGAAQRDCQQVHQVGGTGWTKAPSKDHS